MRIASAWTFSTVHPHRRGEHVVFAACFSLILGSSPQAWGTPQDRPLGAEWPTVHPHRRGEHPNCVVVSGIVSGSSPQAWGTLPDRIPIFPATRFIPTGVGNTTGHGGFCGTRSVHPHRRGEHRGRSGTLPFATGSSPQAWGTHIGHAESDVIARFIPTGVGNTLPSGQME